MDFTDHNPPQDQRQEPATASRPPALRQRALPGLELPDTPGQSPKRTKPRSAGRRSKKRKLGWYYYQSTLPGWKN